MLLLCVPQPCADTAALTARSVAVAALRTTVVGGVSDFTGRTTGTHALPRARERPLVHNMDDPRAMLDE